MQASNRQQFRRSTPSQLLRTCLCLSTVIALSACGGGSDAGSDTTAPVQLGAALPAQGNYIAISQKSLSLSEAARTGSVSVARQGDALNASSVSYRFVSGTAGADDYRGADGVLYWSAGDTSVQQIDFRVESDIDVELTEEFHIELFDLVGDDTLGINDRATVSITDAPCTTALPASIERDTQLTAACYRLSGRATVTNTAQLAVAAGTTIIADENSTITFTGSSTLNAEGTKTNPVIFKGATNKAGFWGGLRLGSTSALHRVGFAEINNATDGINIVLGRIAHFNNNHFENNSEAAISLPMTDAASLGTENSLLNTPRGIEIRGSSIDANVSVHLPAQSVHYVLSSGFVINGTLDIAPGTDLRMAADVALLVLDEGVISAIGTADEPISITGMEPRPGYWNGIQYVSSSSENNQFKHVTLSHGGGDPARAGNIIVDGLDTRISLEHCAITHSAGYGIKYDSSAFQVDTLDVTFAENLLGSVSM